MAGKYTGTEQLGSLSSRFFSCLFKGKNSTIVRDKDCGYSFLWIDSSSTARYILLKTSFASVIISAVRYIQENQILQVLTLKSVYTFIVVNTYRFGLHFGVALVTANMK